MNKYLVELDDEYGLACKYYNNNYNNMYNNIDNNIDNNNDKTILNKLKYEINNLGLSIVAQNIVFFWIKKSINNNNLVHIRHWSYYLLNNTSNNNKYKLKFSTYQKGCPELYPNLISYPIWTNKNINKLINIINLLENSYNKVKNEFLLLNNNGFQPYRSPKWINNNNNNNNNNNINNNNILGQKGHDKGNWNIFYLFLHNLNFKKNQEKCPITCNIIQSIELNYNHSFFSILEPNTHITKHNGPTNKKLRCHLPLIVPTLNNKCVNKIRVGNEIIELKEGKSYIFDDSFEHEAWNNHINEKRVVLIIDIWHPDFNKEEIKFFNYLQNARIRFEKKYTDKNDRNNFFNIIQNNYNKSRYE